MIGCNYNFVDVHAYMRFLMTVAYKFEYKLLALRIPLLCSLVDNLDLYDQPWEFIEMSSKSALYIVFNVSS